MTFLSRRKEWGVVINITINAQVTCAVHHSIHHEQTTELKQVRSCLLPTPINLPITLKDGEDTQKYGQDIR